ncbi:hypothetical protein RF11_10804 [Thelohanellus kitauei]|uniref:Uncharacterized protein n=1 Tax=Thelohanellus kitauei TaxID=669202 RepID=A0A0C2N3H1_THEKT|nr:hypothetical protein RF11_10804 [Thelohanellus kitauei]
MAVIQNDYKITRILLHTKDIDIHRADWNYCEPADYVTKYHDPYIREKLKITKGSAFDDFFIEKQDYHLPETTKKYNYDLKPAAKSKSQSASTSNIEQNLKNFFSPIIQSFVKQ